MQNPASKRGEVFFRNNEIYLIISLSLLIRLIRRYYLRNDFLNIISYIFLIIFLNIHISNFNLNYDIVFYDFFYLNLDTQ